MKKLVFFSFLLLASSFGWIQAFTPQKDNIYQEEFKALKQKRYSGTLLDRRDARGPRRILARVKNNEGVGFSGWWLTGGSVAMSQSDMPMLHSYVSKVCSQLQMRVPTILITKNKTTFLSATTDFSDSTKLLMSSGAILIGQDLLLDVSQKALEAAIAYELCRIKHNHGNKEIVMKWIMPIIVGSKLPCETRRDKWRNTIICFLLTRALLSKLFEKQADRFVYADMGNAKGLIELCRYWQHKDKKVDIAYDEAWSYLKQADISLFYSFVGNVDYFFSRTFHRFYKLYKWINRETFIGSEQFYEARIKKAQEYAASINAA